MDFFDSVPNLRITYIVIVLDLFSESLFNEANKRFKKLHKIGSAMENHGQAETSITSVQE